MDKMKMLILIQKLGFLFSYFVFFFIITLFFIFKTQKSVWRQQVVLTELFNATGMNLQKQKHDLILGQSTSIDSGDLRRVILADFFQKYNSPLLPYVDKIIEVSDKEGFHYGLLPAIAMVESNLCKKIPRNSYNCWGWGIYGSKVTRFSSFGEGIEVVGRGIRKYYVDRGMTTPEQIVRLYNPTNNNNWSGGVRHFLNLLP